MIGDLRSENLPLVRRKSRPDPTDTLPPHPVHPAQSPPDTHTDTLPPHPVHPTKSHPGHPHRQSDTLPPHPVHPAKSRPPASHPRFIRGDELIVIARITDARQLHRSRQLQWQCPHYGPSLAAGGWSARGHMLSHGCRGRELASARGKGCTSSRSCSAPSSCGTCSCGASYCTCASPICLEYRGIR